MRTAELYHYQRLLPRRQLLVANAKSSGEDYLQYPHDPTPTMAARVARSEP